MELKNPTIRRGEIRLPLAGGPPVLAEILEGGQSFQWSREPESESVWVGSIRNIPVTLSLAGNQIAWEVESEEPDPKVIIENYFGLDRDFEQLTDCLPWRSDPVLAEAIHHSRGLRLLAQPIEETLLAFLLSPLKRIPQIREGLIRIDQAFAPKPSRFGFRLPKWEILAEAGEEALRGCGIGYRARSVAATAEFLARNPDYLSALHDLPTNEARQGLLLLPGVGQKIADCVLLFGMGRFEAFPIDTWIARILQTQYGLVGYSNDQLLRFAEVHFGSAAGLAQQYLFAYVRAQQQKAPPKRGLKEQGTGITPPGE